MGLIGKVAGISLFVVCLYPVQLFAQDNDGKEINHQVQFWTSINSIYRINQRWGLLGDFHIRRNNFVTDPSFYFLRFGGNYWIKDNMSVALGYAHMWQAPAKIEWNTFANENRIYQQFQVSSVHGRSSTLQRVRNEQRWLEKIVNDTFSGEYRFTNRVRYLYSYNLPVFSNKKWPSLVLSDEILIQFGKEVVYNTFDQNRLFIGIKQTMGPSWSFDLGYMNVYQQKFSGYQYDMNHTLRLFFYYTGGWKKDTKHKHIHSGEE